MSSFKDKLHNDETRLEEISQSVINDALKCGADECEINIGGVKGLSVSCRDQDVENIEFNRDNGMSITVYKNKRSGVASTNDLSKDSLHEAVLSAVNIAKYSDQDPCAGVCDKDMICKEFKNLDLVFENNVDADIAASKALELDIMATEQMKDGIKKSDG